MLLSSRRLSYFVSNRPIWRRQLLPTRSGMCFLKVPLSRASRDAYWPRPWTKDPSDRLGQFIPYYNVLISWRPLPGCQFI